MIKPIEEIVGELEKGIEDGSLRWNDNKRQEISIERIKAFLCQALATRDEEYRKLLESKKGVLWNDDPNRHLENIAKRNLIDDILSALPNQ